MHFMPVLWPVDESTSADRHGFMSLWLIQFPLGLPSDSKGWFAQTGLFLFSGFAPISNRREAVEKATEIGIL
jgi:hypothetical protein